MVLCAGITLLRLNHFLEPAQAVSNQNEADPSANDVAMIQSHGLVAFTVMDILNHRKTPDFGLE